MKHLKLGPDQPVQVMGVINLSPESFYQGSYVPGDLVVEIARRMVEDGAQILDIGARSTAPGVMPISRQEERKRLIPVLKDLIGNVDCAISIDTMFSDIAEEALNLGADIINDISGLHADERMVEVVADFACPVVLMASENRPGDVIGIDAVLRALERIIAFAESKGISPTKIIIDPGVGRWVPEKAALYDLELLDQFERLQIFGKPILAAVSRKSFIGALLNEPPDKRLFGSLAATALAVYKGATIIRTHDIKETCDVVRVAEAIKPKRVVSQREDIRMELLNIISPEDAFYHLRAVGTSAADARTMKDKSVLRAVRLSNVPVPEAMRIKQELFAVGGDAALPAGIHERENVNLILFGTLGQIEHLITRLECSAPPIISDLLRETLVKEHDPAYKYELRNQ